MTDKQHAFAREFNALMKKYNVAYVYAYFDGTVRFVSNDIELVTNGFERETGLQVYEKTSQHASVVIDTGECKQ